MLLPGQRVVDTSVDPEWTLLTYLRWKLRLCGTKLGCGEGGCGACTVMVSKFNRVHKQIQHFSVNACLAPVVSMHGLAVTTIEGIGSSRSRLHAVQERLAEYHGSQCGFCTPGILMSMYTLLRNRAVPSSEDLDVYFQGNLCRCTGYRPIVDCFRTFAECPSTGIDGQQCLSKVCCKQLHGFKGGVNSIKGPARKFSDVSNGFHGAVSKRCSMQASNSEDTSSFHDSQPYNSSMEVIFPPELQLSSKFDEETLFFQGKNMSWYRPTQLDDLILLKKVYPNAKIVVGNTELGVEMKLKNCQYTVMLQATHINELTSIIETQHSVKFGASVTLTEIEAACQRQSALHPPWKVQVFAEVSKILRHFGGKQIRNVAAIGGNIMTASPISDLNPIWLAAGCQLEVASGKGTRIIKMNENFFTEYRRNAMMPEEILVSIHVPYLEQTEYFTAFKQSRRRDDDIAIVNAAFRLKLQDLKVDDVKLCFGGMSSTTVVAMKTMEFMCGKTWSKKMIEGALSSLSAELLLSPSTPGGMVRFRQSLALSFLFKFYLRVSFALNSELVSEDSVSAIQPLSKGTPKAAQMFSSDRGEASLLAVGKSIMHASGRIHVTGEAVFCDDIPRYENELYLGLVLSQKAHAKIINIDPTEALGLDGVHGFICHEDLPTERNTLGVTDAYMDEEVFASTEV